MSLKVRFKLRPEKLMYITCNFEEKYSLYICIIHIFGFTSTSNMLLDKLILVYFYYDQN